LPRSARLGLSQAQYAFSRGPALARVPGPAQFSGWARGGGAVRYGALPRAEFRPWAACGAQQHHPGLL